MSYDDIIKTLAIKENTTKEEIEKELSLAVKHTNLDCSASDLIFGVAELIKKTIYSI